MNAMPVPNIVVVNGQQVEIVPPDEVNSIDLAADVPGFEQSMCSSRATGCKRQPDEGSASDCRRARCGAGRLLLDQRESGAHGSMPRRAVLGA